MDFLDEKLMVFIVIGLIEFVIFEKKNLNLSKYEKEKNITIMNLTFVIAIAFYLVLNKKKINTKKELTMQLLVFIAILTGFKK